MKRSLTIAITWFITCCFLSLPLPTLAQKSILSAGQCNQKKMAQYEADFDKLIAIQEAEGNSVSRQTKKDMEIVASAYIDMSAKCFDQLYAKNSSALGIKSFQIDNGGIAMLPDSKSLLVSEFTLRGTKWGANSPFVRGENQLGPRSAGGVVTYSFIANGVSHAFEQVFLPTADNNLRFSSLPTYSSCFETEIVRAFAMWSAVANIQFQRVSDNGVPTNGNGASGDIRIGAHTFDGPLGILAHAFFPPPTANTAAGDLHFDRAEFWTCDTRGFDIGIVATHEIGHSIGLQHEERGALAIMNPFYNADLPFLTSDDIIGARSIYGPSNVTMLEPVQRMGVAVSFLDGLPLVVPYRTTPEECSSSLGADPTDVNFVGTLISTCSSENRLFGAFAQFYNFSLSRSRSVTINMFSPVFDTFLYLLDSNGNIITLNDDDGSGLNSLIQTTLPAGDYTIEATSFSSRQTGDFTLNIQ